MSSAAEKTIKDVVTEFLGSAPTLTEIAEYRLPEALQLRAHELLDKDREGRLSDDERAEMEEFHQLDHLLTLVTAQARLKLKEREVGNADPDAESADG